MKKKKIEEELVALIAAVIAANMGVSLPELNIKKIRKIDNSIWTKAARIEQIN